MCIGAEAQRGMLLYLRRHILVTLYQHVSDYQAQVLV